MELGLATAVASDAHGGARRPALTTALDVMLAHGIAPWAAQALVDTAPRRLMARGLERVPSQMA